MRSSTPELSSGRVLTPWAWEAGRSRRWRLGDRGAGQKLDLGVRGQQVKMLRLPAGQDVEINVVAHGCGGDYRILLVLVG
jgi:hypothetical protein